MVMISGQIRLFQAWMKVMVASVARIGRLSGIMIRVRMAQVPAPSTRAAASRSRGMVRKYCRTRKMPYEMCPRWRSAGCGR